MCTAGKLAAQLAAHKQGAHWLVCKKQLTLCKIWTLVISLLLTNKRNKQRKIKQTKTQNNN